MTTSYNIYGQSSLNQKNLLPLSQMIIESYTSKMAYQAFLVRLRYMLNRYQIIPEIDMVKSDALILSEEHIKKESTTIETKGNEVLVRNSCYDLICKILI